MNEATPQVVQDRSLAAKVAAGDQRAFDEFFKEYFPRLFRFTLTRVDNNADLAEEIVQRTMCIVVRKMGTYRGEALLFTWLCQICRNETSSVFRQRHLELQDEIPIEDHPAVQAALESVAADDGRPETARRREEIANFVRVTLEHLPANYAQALEMKYVQGCSVSEIARSLNLGNKAAESILSRARTAFKERFRAIWNIEPNFIVD
ncbi:MAG: sigma-70 family RNA polymerase sigma factor [Chromatiales bacterium]|nr:MAG: sigma-70 family RNA polymerase sigma factor [Chromatiales bacterium]